MEMHAIYHHDLVDVVWAHDPSCECTLWWQLKELSAKLFTDTGHKVRFIVRDLSEDVNSFPEFYGYDLVAETPFDGYTVYLNCGVPNLCVDHVKPCYAEWRYELDAYISDHCLHGRAINAGSLFNRALCTTHTLDDAGVGNYNRLGYTSVACVQRGKHLYITLPVNTSARYVNPLDKLIAHVIRTIGAPTASLNVPWTAEQIKSATDTFIDGINRGRIDEIKRRVTTTENDIKNYRNLIQDRLEELESCKDELYGMERRKLENVGAIRKSISEVFSAKDIYGVKLVGTKLTFSTGFVYVTDPRTEMRYVIGKFDVSIELRAARYDRYFLAVNSWCRVRGYDRQIMEHPHVFSGGRPCAGNAQDMMFEAQRAHDYAGMVAIVMQFLASVNVDDPAGHFVYKWMPVPSWEQPDLASCKNLCDETQLEYLELVDSQCDSDKPFDGTYIEPVYELRHPDDDDEEPYEEEEEEPDYEEEEEAETDDR